MKRLLKSMISITMVVMMLTTGVQSVLADDTGQNWHYVVKPEWGNRYDFIRGLSIVSDPTYERWGCVDMNGNVVIEPTWEGIRPFSEGYAVITKNGPYGSSDAKYGYIDTTAKIISELQWDLADDFSEGFAVVGIN